MRAIKRFPIAPVLATATAWLMLGAATHAQSPTGAAAESSAVAAATWAVNAAPSVALRVTYHAKSTGLDGVQRDTRYANLMVRGPGRVWLEREMPPSVRESLSHDHVTAHGPHAAHAHDDEAQGAPLFLEREVSGKEIVQLVFAKTKRVIKVDTAHHGNVGYGGSWDAAYWLVTPASLGRMTAQGRSKAGVQRYVAKQSQQATTVDWDVAGQFPRRVERRDRHGAAYYLMTASRIAMPSAMPWSGSEKFGRGDYSDLLD